MRRHQPEAGVVQDCRRAHRDGLMCQVVDYCRVGRSTTSGRPLVTDVRDGSRRGRGERTETSVDEERACSSSLCMSCCELVAF